MRDGERCVERSGERAVQPAAAGARGGGRSALRAVPGSPHPASPAPLARPAREMDRRSASPRRLLAPPLAAPVGAAWGKGLGGRPGRGQMDG